MLLVIIMVILVLVIVPFLVNIVVGIYHYQLECGIFCGRVWFEVETLSFVRQIYGRKGWKYGYMWSPGGMKVEINTSLASFLPYNFLLRGEGGPSPSFQRQGVMVFGKCDAQMLLILLIH